MRPLLAGPRLPLPRADAPAAPAVESVRAGRRLDAERTGGRGPLPAQLAHGRPGGRGGRDAVRDDRDQGVPSPRHRRGRDVRDAAAARPLARGCRSRWVRLRARTLRRRQRALRDRLAPGVAAAPDAGHRLAGRRGRPARRDARGRRRLPPRRRRLAAHGVLCLPRRDPLLLRASRRGDAARGRAPVARAKRPVPRSGCGARGPLLLSERSRHVRSDALLGAGGALLRLRERESPARPRVARVRLARRLRRSCLRRSPGGHARGGGRRPVAAPRGGRDVRCARRLRGAADARQRHPPARVALRLRAAVPALPDSASGTCFWCSSRCPCWPRSASTRCRRSAHRLRPGRAFLPAWCPPYLRPVPARLPAR